ncbi:MAG: DUF1643 domain-containing protein [Pseudomonadota bacterium]
MTRADDLHDPGGKVRLKLPNGVIGGARFSKCGRYRQALTRDWTAQGATPRAVLFVGMNPSVAAADVSDPTCHRELIFAQDWGFTRYLKGNVLDWRATSPKDIPHDPSEACSAENLPVLREMADEAELIIMAFGKLHKRHHGVLEAVTAAMVESGKPLQCLGLNKDGSAKHPLYLRKDTKPVSFPVN